MVGAGVFTTTGFLIRDLGSTSAVLIAWALGGLTAVCGALAYAELWRALPATDLVRPAELVNVLTKLAMVVPYAAITRQVRPSAWSNGAECLLEAAMLVASDDTALQQRVQRTAQAMVARQQLEATDELADVLGL